MITFNSAKKLKSLGLQWKPQSDDRFVVPDRGLDDHIFVLNNMTIQHEILKGHPAITFNGATEWALDYIFQIEALWLPREEQLRELLLSTLRQQMAEPRLVLHNKPGGYGYVCVIDTAVGKRSFEGDSASDAYAEALIFSLA